MFFFKKSDKKKRVAFLANCQGGVYKSLLARNSFFKSKYEIVDLPLVHMLTPKDIEKVYKLMESIDILFYQPLVNSKYEAFFIGNLKKHMPFFSKQISIPVLYFNFYAPHCIYVLPGQLEKFKIDYHDINILLAWYNKIEKKDLYDKITTIDFYSSKFLDEISEINFSRIKERELKLDIKYHDFLKGIYKKSFLFNTFNHPKNKVLSHILSEILIKLDINQKIPEPSKDVLGNIKIAIYPSIQNFCNADIDSTDVIIKRYKVFNENISLESMINHYYDYYDSNNNKIKTFIENNFLKSNDNIEQLISKNFSVKFNIQLKN